ncbi:MAG: IS701 family transposase [Azonexus sp.]
MDKGSYNVSDRALKRMANHLSDHLEDYHECFQTETFDGHELCQSYITGLLKTESGKRNIERLSEEIEMPENNYQQLHHFITESPWSSARVVSLVAQNTSDLYADQPDYRSRDVAYIIDESAHLKKGTHSAGVSRQYAGVIGKVDNCQVGVYASLVWQCHSTLVNCRLFLPECWTSNPERCDKAGIPPDARIFKTKLELALDMVRADMAAGVQFSWVGGDGLYGHGWELSNAIENMGLTFLFDVHCDQRIYTVEPAISVPEKKPGPGRQPTKPQTDIDPVTVKAHGNSLSSFSWRNVTVRNTVKGPLTLSMHAERVWIWDGKSDCAKERVLVISRNLADNKIKYSLSNVDYIETPIERLAYMQAQRYWVERAFQEAKSEIGMSDYQVRKWSAWYHHMALVMLSLSFIVKERITHKVEYPLLSCRDVRLMIIALLMKDETMIEKRIEQMKVRHNQRQRDIERHYKIAQLT